MKKNLHLYVSRKNVLIWLMTLCMAASAVTRIAFSGLKGTGDGSFVWSQIILPIGATTLCALIALLNGENQFYKTAIPVWMMCLYAGLWISGNVSSRMMTWLFWVALIFFAVSYTDITAGHRGLFFLLPMVCVPMGILLYFYRRGILSGDLEAYKAQVSPYIMVTRNTSDNLFSDSIEISQIDRYIRQKRREGLTSFGITHVLLACYVRSLCRFPGLNRFISGQKVYSRGDDIQYCMTIKKEMRADSPDTVIKVHLKPTDTAEDVYNKYQAAVDSVKNTSSLDSDFDATAGALTLIPGVFLKFAVWLLKTLDYFGLLPGFLLEVSPFHGSLFFTSMGSLGIPPIYHHLYDFGNLPVFGAFGMKRRAYEITEDGSVVQRKYVDVKFTLDERIVDGYYYAAFFKHYKRILAHPEILDRPPEEVLKDID